ncbi:restriction endonuclease subunit S domain-containing protein [Mycoplasma parvum]|uniref:restriction endonuclease subunit S n=1 Tax=Mycoplasma parvum TaxID=984991 RepID=UPI001F1FE396|nr:restriction endonuclease subunit S [Mycoplasma parvum]
MTRTGKFVARIFRGKFEVSDCCFLISPKIQDQIYFLLEAINLIIFELHKNCPGVKVLKEFEFKPTSIIIPNKELLEKFNSICEDIQIKIENLNKGIEKLERMKKDLHKMIFNQKITIN